MMINVLTIFAAPEATFKRVRDNKTAWLFPFALLLLLSVVVIYLQMPVLEPEMLKTIQGRQVDPALYDTVIAQAKTTAYVTGVVSPAIMIFVTGLLLMLLNLAMFGQAKYMQLVSVAAFSAMPGIIGSLITAILVRTMDVQSAADVTLSLGAFISDKSGQWYPLLSLVNPFTLWGVVLYVIGSAVMMNRPRKKVGTWIIAAWLVLSLGSALLV